MADQAQVLPIQDDASKIAGEFRTNSDRTIANEATEARQKRMRKEKQKEEAEKEQRFLYGLQQTIKAQSRFVTYACGGSIPFKTSMATNDDANAIDPIQIRFDEDGKGISMDFPCIAAASGELNSLVKACQPATFGRGDKDIHDDEYRKAGKLDRQSFATTFCPYEAGIIDVVSQLLVPQTKRSKHHCSIKAELYKLNVYSAPNGKFKAHVDTPRSEAQIGSLVVCLPVDHEGGQLAVRNAGQQMVFDWSTSAANEAAPCIQWAAFYSDCEHEVYEVTSGHRVTLTYNLYLSRGAGHLAGSPSALDPTQLPLYKTLKSALQSPGFLRQGRVLAIWLNHSYAHTNKYLNFLPSSLKGADMSLYETARALGLQIRLGPVVASVEGNYVGEESKNLFSDKFFALNEGDKYSGNLTLDSEVEAGFGRELPEGKITWINPFLETYQGYGRAQNVVGKGAEKYKEAQMAYLTYGNEAVLSIGYSRVVMLISVPPSRLRGREHAREFWADIRDDMDVEYHTYENSDQTMDDDTAE